MKKTLLIILLLSSIKIYSQDFELRKTPSIQSKIIYKDGTTEKGFLWMESNVFYPRLKSQKKGKSKKIDYKKVDTIITNPDNVSKKRVFQYLKHNYNKFQIFVELIHSDKISIYINGGADLFYSDFDRRTIKEKLIGVGSKKDTLELVNGKEMTVNTKYSYFNNVNSSLTAENNKLFQYYILKEGDSILLKVEKNKRFLKKSKKKLKNCPSLVKDLEQEKITLKELPLFIEHYKEKCLAKEH